MQYLVVVARDLGRFAESDFGPVLGPEALVVRALYAEGVVREIWSRQDEPGAVILIEAQDMEAAEAALARLPLQQRGMLRCRIIPLKPYRGFSPDS